MRRKQKKQINAYDKQDGWSCPVRKVFLPNRRYGENVWNDPLRVEKNDRRPFPSSSGGVRVKSKKKNLWLKNKPKTDLKGGWTEPIGKRVIRVKFEDNYAPTSASRTVSVDSRNEGGTGTSIKKRCLLLRIIEKLRFWSINGCENYNGDFKVGCDYRRKKLMLHQT